jgi:hypothetical protein
VRTSVEALIKSLRYDYAYADDYDYDFGYVVYITHMMMLKI